MILPQNGKGHRGGNMATSRNHSITNPRELAVRLLTLIADEKLLVPQASNRVSFDLKPADRQLCFEIVYGTLRFLPGLERVLREFCPKPKYPEPIRWVLLTSLYQIGFMRVPDYATVNEAIVVVKRMKMGGLRGFVNGVLRNAGRRGKELWPDVPDQSWLLPKWLWERFRDQYDEAECKAWLEAWRQRPQISYWKPDGRGLEGDMPSPDVPHGYRHDGQMPEEAFLKQRCYVQNESSQAISEIACRLASKSVLDLCAAPGGKACYISAFGKPEVLLACDISDERLSKVHQNKKRLDLDFETSVADGTQVVDDQKYDLVLIDAPCSGLGIIGRHPEIKMHKTGPAPKRLRQLQAQLMARGFERVKQGGYLLFTVCSLDHSEIPKLPENASIAMTTLKQVIPEGMADMDQERFFIAPTRHRDGFQGILLKKS